MSAIIIIFIVYKHYRVYNKNGRDITPSKGHGVLLEKDMERYNKMAANFLYVIPDNLGYPTIPPPIFADL